MGIDIFRSCSYKAGEINLNNSKRMYGDAKRKPKKTEAVK